MPDVLGTEPPGRRPPSALRRRWLAGGVAVVLAAGAFVLAGRSEPEPRRSAPPTATATPQLRPTWIPGDEVRALGGTGRWAYALLASCRPEGCRYRLARRDSLADDHAWLELTRLPTKPDPDGLSPADLVTSGEDTVAVVGRSGASAWVSDDGGINFRRVGVLPGRAVPAVPPDLTAALGRCAGCQGRIGVFDPATGRRSRLAEQPPLDPPPTAFADSGDALWAASASVTRITVATSTDRGRTWRTSSLPQTTPLRGDLHLAAGGPAAYLVAESLDRRFPARVWVSRGTTAAWRDVPSDPGLRGEVTGAVAAGDQLVVSAGGRLFSEVGGRIRPVGTPAGRPIPPVDGLAVGDGRVLARVAHGPPAVVVADGDGWELEALPT